MKEDARAFPRYHVEDTDVLKGILESGAMGARLSTIGLGGCSFQAWETDENLIPPARVSCTFALSDGSEKRIEGQLLYLKPKAFGGKFIYLYGIQFDSNQRMMMAPVINTLEDLAKTGVIARA